MIALAATSARQLVAIVYQSDRATITLYSDGSLIGTHRYSACGFRDELVGADIDIRDHIQPMLDRMEASAFIEGHAADYHRSEARERRRALIVGEVRE